jgi:hypothetical protein
MDFPGAPLEIRLAGAYRTPKDSCGILSVTEDGVPSARVVLKQGKSKFVPLEIERNWRQKRKIG